MNPSNPVLIMPKPMPSKVTAVVRDLHGCYQNIDYSAPAEFIGQEITLHLQGDGKYTWEIV